MERTRVSQDRIDEPWCCFAGRETAAETPGGGPIEGFGLYDHDKLTQTRQCADERCEEGLRGLDYQTVETRQ